MPATDPELRELLIDLLRAGGSMSRGDLLQAIAERYGIEARKRSLRAEVSTELRAMENDGILIDGGPIVWLK